MLSDLNANFRSKSNSLIGDIRRFQHGEHYHREAVMSALEYCGALTEI